ncbi:argininosuccinate lyase [Planctomicrobium sp. SH527]|uniref:argininosuccinate lyase n=1 Tax=Planctomicrobium sp. SH527 TaxID=3448123 RepID=UPI003F5B7407
MSQKAWGGRFSEPTDLQVELFTESISFDSRLAAVDVEGSQTHARMLARVGLISNEECEQICTGLTEILGEIRRGEMEYKSSLEDIHMHIESALIRRLGDVGRKLHTGRSRNDQVATDIRLYIRNCIDSLDAQLAALQHAFVSRGERDLDIVLPGYTHLQRAQPVSATHYWLAYCEKFQRDRERLADCRKRLNFCPLGAAALAGSTLPLDRDFTAQALHFTAPAANSLDISSDRDYLAEFTSVLSLIAVHLSGWAEEWILWCTTEFGFLKLPDKYTTGSSIMPQKKNPDVLELIRGKSARVIAASQQLFVLLKGLPMAYNRDLQEDKLAAFTAFDTIDACLQVAPSIVAHAELNRARIQARIEEGFLDATALMEYLIKIGVPMRTGHEIVGKLVAECEGRGCRLADLTLAELQAVAPAVKDDIYSVLGAENAANALITFGAGGKAQVQQRLAAWIERLA